MSAVRLRVALLAAAAFGALVFAPMRASAVITNVTSADDVCSPAASPCVVSDTVQVVSGSVLDFGLRHVQIIGAGLFDADSGSFTLRAGQLTATVSGNAFKIKGAIGDGFSLGGTVIVEVRRTCSGNPALRCFSDSQCSIAGAGTCSVGSGQVNLAGKVLGSADIVGSFLLRAGGSIAVNADILMTGISFEADGGFVELSANEDVIVSARIDANSGGDGGGGEICLTARRDVIVNKLVSTTGGNFDGGSIFLDAGRDLLITDDVIADASTGEGYGGSLELNAGGDITVSGGTGTNRLLLSTQGNTGVDGGESFGGDGGPQDYFAGGSISIGEFVRIRADGAAPDGYGEVIAIDAGGDVFIEGDIDAKARGAFGGGGELEIFAFGELELTSKSAVDLTGTDGGGGTASFSPLGGVTLDGVIDASSPSTSITGLIDISIPRDFSLGGTLFLNGGDANGIAGFVSIAACNVNITSTGSIDTRASLATNSIEYRGQMSLASGGSIKATGGGATTIVYRSTPPVLLGTVTPAATIMRNAGLAACPLCANGVIDPGESCDDGNTVSGDGCTTFCQNEACIAQTPGYPSTPLCDDGDGCTLDICNPVTNTCEHSTSCDDGFACTVDTCMGTTCIHTPDDGLCNDSNVCTDEFCSAASGCVFVPNANLCDDGQFCNGDDSCAGGTCSVHVGAPCAGMPECQNACDEITQECLAPFQFPCGDDGNPCTDDICNGLGQCIHLQNSGECDDGVFCNGQDFCVNGACTIHLGDPCAGGADCFDVCNEVSGQCLAPPGAGCSDDGNVCTDDTCDGAGTCLHTNNTAACDDGDFCTTADVCSAGECVAGDITPMAAQITFGRKPGPADDRAKVKARYALADQSADPSVVGLSIELRDSDNAAFFNAALPASDIVNSGGRGRTFKFRDKERLVASANGVVSAVVKRNPKKNEVRVNLRTDGVEFLEPVAKPFVSMSLLFGSDPQADECLTARSVPCVTRVSGSVKVRCRE